MLFQVRGTSGSGKTSVMRQVMAAYNKWEPHFIEGRKQPLYYTHALKGRPPIIVLGHYEIPTGGGDTIGSTPKIFAAIKKLPKFSHLLCEGLLLSEDVIWVEKTKLSGHEWFIVFLTTSQELCLERVKKRQEEKGREPADPERVIRKLTRRIETIERARVRLIDAGINCTRCSSGQAAQLILNRMV